jgi:two-component system OmpR family response regulator
LAASETSPSVPEAPQPSGSGSHILVIDDDAGVREVLANLLRRSGYRVSSATNGEAGWQALCANSFDALITDHAMPHLTGLDLLRRVRTGPLNTLPVILISGRMPWGEADLLDLVRPGMAMVKPFSFFELLTSVRSLLPITTCTEPIVNERIQPKSGRKKMRSPAMAWQDDARTRLPSRTLIRAS